VTSGKGSFNLTSRNRRVCQYCNGFVVAKTWSFATCLRCNGSSRAAMDEDISHALLSTPSVTAFSIKLSFWAGESECSSSSQAATQPSGQKLFTRVRNWLRYWEFVRMRFSCMLLARLISLSMLSLVVSDNMLSAGCRFDTSGISHELQGGGNFIQLVRAFNIKRWHGYHWQVLDHMDDIPISTIQSLAKSVSPFSSKKNSKHRPVRPKWPIRRIREFVATSVLNRPANGWMGLG
jgi:hypothetical protein